MGLPFGSARYSGVESDEKLRFVQMHDWFVAHYDVLKDFAGPAVASVAFVITTILAVVGLRTFGKWKREKLEERRMETAFQALKLAYQSTFVFEHIRSPLIEGYEWAEMPVRAGDDENKRSRRGSYYSVMKRVEANKDFFKAAWDIQPACMAIFGAEIQDAFLGLHKARRQIEVACQMLHNHVDDFPMIPDSHKELWQQLRADLCGAEAPFAPEGDRVGKQLTEFREGIERVCRPLVEHRVGKKKGAASQLNAPSPPLLF